jgi:hypothetical protein
MAHQIIIGIIGDLQGDSITGTGSLQRLKTAVNVSLPWEPSPSQTEAQGAAVSYVDEIAEAIQQPFCPSDIVTWSETLEGLNTAAGA